MKQIAWLYVVLAALAVAFSAVSIAIVMLGPRPLLVSKKLKLGALIISFNTMLAGCYSAKDSKDTETPDSGAADTGTQPVEVTCYGDVPPVDTGAPSTETDTGEPPIDSEILCYEVTNETDVECYVDVSSDDSDVPSIDTEIACYDTEVDTGEPWIETDIECYDPSMDYPTDSEEPVIDAGIPSDTDIECYSAVEDVSDASPVEDTEDPASDDGCYMIVLKREGPDGEAES